MKLVLNELSAIPLISTNVDSDKDLAYIPTAPLPKRASIYLSGARGQVKVHCGMHYYSASLPNEVKKVRNIITNISTI